LWDAVKKELGGRGTVAILGVSGVGKSTLVNTWLDFGTRQEKKKRIRRKQRKTTSEDPAVVVLTNEIPGGDAGVSPDASIADMPILIGNKHVDEVISGVNDLSPSQAAETTAANRASFKDVSSDSEPIAATKTSAPLPIDDDEAHENHDNSEVRAVSPKTRRHRRPARSKKRNHPVHTAERATVEFGIQPLLFKDASGMPLYCPYPLPVSIPAMMIPHLLVAGVVEGIVTAGVYSYVKKVSPDTIYSGTGIRMKPLYAGLGVLIVLSPLGLLAAGTAWGEWDILEIKELTGFIPEAMKNGFSFNAVMGGYTVPGLGGALGYIFSAIAGVLLIMLCIRLISKKIANKENR
jgi:energy-coupling factor transporter ATP-binding protein EcfA2